MFPAVLSHNLPQASLSTFLQLQEFGRSFDIMGHNKGRERDGLVSVLFPAVLPVKGTVPGRELALE